MSKTDEDILREDPDLAAMFTDDEDDSLNNDEVSIYAECFQKLDRLMDDFIFQVFEMAKLSGAFTKNRNVNINTSMPLYMPTSPAVKIGHSINSIKSEAIRIKGPKSSDQCDAELSFLQECVPKIVTFTEFWTNIIICLQFASFLFLCCCKML